jgi:hypothetical protein
VKKNSKTIEFPLEDIVDISVILKNALNFSTADGKLFEIHSAKPTSATKYLEMIKTLKLALQEKANTEKMFDAAAS